MLRNNPLLAQLKEQIRAATPRVEGTVKGTDKTFGFVETDDGKSYFLPPPAMKKLLPGDRIVAVLQEEGEKTSAEPEALLAAGMEQFIGRVSRKSGRLGVLPDHPHVNQPLNARLRRTLDDGEIADGDWVVARLVRHPLREDDRSFLVQIEERVLKHDDPAVPWRITLARHGLEQEPPAPGNDWTLADEGLHREDLTGEPFFSIDSETTRDMDDALRIHRRPQGGWQLVVAVADPTAYIDEGDAADLEARHRAFTVYLPGQTVTMLPEPLSHDLCSLVAGEERPALVCTLDVEADGSLGEYRFAAATIRSRAKLVYDRVSDWLEGQGDWSPEEEIADQLSALADFTQARIAWRSRHAALAEERPDYVFDLDDAGNVADIRIEARRVANRMIEEAMIAANICCAGLLAEQVGQGIFNHHRAFDPDKVAAACEFLAAQQIDVAPEALTELARYPELRSALEKRPDPWLQARVRQFQGFGGLSLQPGPHFGLGAPAYATWTSPIRKYGDMVNHRLIKQSLKGETAAAPSQSLADHLTERRRLNRLTERGVKDWLYVRFLGAAVKEGRELEAEVMAIKRGGMRVRLTAYGAVAFVPAPLIHDKRDALKMDEKEGQVLVEDAVRFRLGDLVRVVLTEANEETRSLVARPAG